MSDPTSRPWGERVREALGSFVLGVCYIGALEIVANVLMHDPNERMNPNFYAEFHGWVKNMNQIPALFRWDAVWYMNMATSGYPGKDGDAQYNVAFFPLYGMLERWGGALTGMAPAYVGIWLSRILLPINVGLLREFVRLSGYAEEHGWATVVVLLSSPVAYNMAGPLPEGTFLFLTLTTVVLATRGRLLWAMIPAALVSFTRVHAFAFLVGLGAFGIARQFPRPFRVGRLAAFAPAVGCGLGIGGLLLYFHQTRGDVLGA